MLNRLENIIGGKGKANQPFPKVKRHPLGKRNVKDVTERGFTTKKGGSKGDNQGGQPSGKILLEHKNLLGGKIIRNEGGAQTQFFELKTPSNLTNPSPLKEGQAEKQSTTIQALQYPTYRGKRG